MANNYGVSRRTLLGVGGLMLGVGLVGCSDSEEGWESVTVDRITVSHPTEWVEKPPENENFTKNFTDGPHGMQIAGQVAAAGRCEDGTELPIQLPAFGGQRLDGRIGCMLDQSEH